MKKLIIDNFKKTGSLFGIIGLIGGTVSDILQPLFPFVSYIFFFTSITSILLFLTIFLSKSLQTKIIPAFLCSFFIMFFSGIFYFFQGEQKQEKGFLAETIPLIFDTDFRSDNLKFKPEVGTMLVFPSWLKHSVYPFYVNGERRSMSFNAYHILKWLLLTWIRYH